MRNIAGRAAAPRDLITYTIIFLAVTAVDQLTKFAVRSFFAPGESVDAIDGLLSITYVMNRGAAFGFLAGKSEFLIVVPLIMCIGILAAVVFIKWPRSVSILMVLIAAGGINNAVDRIVLGYVTDMIAVSFFPPVFNVADICVTVSCVILAVVILFGDDNLSRNEE